MPRQTVAPGIVTDARTAAMLTEAQRLAGFNWLYAQGSYNGTAVAQSAGTHAGGGVVDIRTVPMRSRSQKLAAVRALRRVGFAAWLRPYVENLWGEHIHAVAIGCPDLAPAASRQVAAYYQGRDGLAGNRPDPHADLGVKPTTWEAYSKPLPVVSWSKLRAGKPASPDVERVQRALNRYMPRRTPLVVDGKWGRKTSRRWGLAVVKSGGKRGVHLLRFFADLYGKFRAAP
jgi:hypothetical protein